MGSGQHPEPQYHGKKLTEWAGQIDLGYFLRRPEYQQHQEKSERAIAAVQHIGTNALPMALDLLAAKDSWFKQKLEEWTQRYDYDDWPGKPFVPVYIKSSGEKNYEGANIIWALGSATKPIIPSLIQLFQSPDRGISANMMFALPGAGTNVVLPLTQLLVSTNKDVRIRAATILGRYFGSQAYVAVPTLLECLGDTNLLLIRRLGAIHALGFIKGDAPVIVPAVIRQIKTEIWLDKMKRFQNDLLMGNYFSVLGNLGTNAQPAVPFLVHILESKSDEPHSRLKEDALGNLLKIDSVTAKPFLDQRKASRTNGLFNSSNPPSKQLQLRAAQTNSSSP